MYIVVTNNVKCRDRYQGKLKVDLLENGSYIDVLIKVRNYIHKGYRLETHPMAGSLKPNQIPYKTIIISDSEVEKEEFYQFEMVMENSIQSCEKFMKDRRTPDWPENILEDFRDVDLSLIEGAVKKIIYKEE